MIWFIQGRQVLPAETSTGNVISDGYNETFQF